MNDFSIWPIVVCLGVAYALASTPLLKAADVPVGTGGKRNSTIDGTRGFLALSVVIHHGAFYRGFIANGIWDVPPSNLYTGIGEGSVSMFFMITGYLFWRKVINEQSRGGVDWLALAIGRVFRIAPIYWLATLLLLGAVGFLTNWTLHEPAPSLARNVLLTLVPGVFLLAPVNNYQDTSLLLAGVTWSLRYEWAFYLSLPVLAQVLRFKTPLRPWSLRLPWLMPAVVLVASLAVHEFIQARSLVFIGLFCIGMIAAAGRPVRAGPDWLRSVCVVAFIAAAVTMFPRSYQPGPALLLGAAFILIVSGCTVFGLLTSRPAIRLGDISYGIYLLQGLPLAVAYWPAPLRNFAAMGPVEHWSLLLAAMLVLIVMATVAHVYVELPGKALGNRLLGALRAWNPALGQQSRAGTGVAAGLPRDPVALRPTDEGATGRGAVR